MHDRRIVLGFGARSKTRRLFRECQEMRYDQRINFGDASILDAQGTRE